MDEGKDVSSLKDLCLKISQNCGRDEYVKTAHHLTELFDRLPVDKGYPYIEPSELSEIKKERPIKRHNFVNSLSDEELKDKLSGAWLGRISGCLLGKPIEGYMSERLKKLLKGTNNYPASRYITSDEFSKELIEELDINIYGCWADKIDGISPVDDDTNYTVLALKLIETYGFDFKPNDVLEAWLSWVPILFTCTAERVAYRNAASGMLAPQTATFKNPYREWIGAQIRGDFFGYINPANTERAAEFAFRDASISHIKNGIYGEMFIAAMLAAAAVCDDIKTVIEAGLDEIPQKSRLRENIEKVLKWHSDGISSEEAINNIHELFKENEMQGWCHTVPNAMIVATALLYGNKDFGKSIGLAVQSAFDTDCNGATTGSIVGMMIGEKNIPEYWIKPFNKRLKTSIDGYNEVFVDDLVQKTFNIIKNKTV